MVIPTAMVITARLRTRRGMPWPDCHILINGPSLGWFSSQLWKRSDELAKHQLASNIKGVVGRIGKNIPTTPNIMQSQPAPASNIFLNDTKDPRC